MCLSVSVCVWHPNLMQQRLVNLCKSCSVDGLRNPVKIPRQKINDKLHLWHAAQLSAATFVSFKSMRSSQRSPSLIVPNACTMSQHNQAPLRHQDVQNQLFHLEPRTKITTYIYIYYTRRYINTYIMWYDLIWFHMNSESIWTDDVYTCTAEKAARFNDSERMNLPPVLKCKDSSALPCVDQSGTSEAYQAHHAAIGFIKKNQHFRAFRETWSC